MFKAFNKKFLGISSALIEIPVPKECTGSNQFKIINFTKNG